MRYRSRIVAAGLFVVAGGLLAGAGFFADALTLDLAHAAAVGFLGLVILALGLLMLRRGLAERPRKERPADAPPQPLPYYTRNCPFCGRRLGLKEEKCPQCRRKMPAGLTCSAGEPDADAARASFAAAREAALARGSASYVWRAVQDEATCERCANNDGHVFQWEREPIGGHAGARARCRCRPEPVFPDKGGPRGSAASSPTPRA
ncbi:phage minor head protein [Desulfovibrio sp.]|uniref:phage minor head protein n=1 Tax=Desulfovibrio sp. TaxID=885 RepID=UPI0023C71EF5|nr:phage minor head protein [Desulfovibrio sp.]MDE7242100.1 hypothetical protein [Desulfovibrio sp.]